MRNENITSYWQVTRSSPASSQRFARGGLLVSPRWADRRANFFSWNIIAVVSFIRSAGWDLYVLGWVNTNAMRSAVRRTNMVALARVIVLVSVVVPGFGWSGIPNDDPLAVALEESERLDYNELYEEALVRLDMEDTYNVTTQELSGGLQLEVGSVAGSGSCDGSIRQVEGIPWEAGNSSMHFITNSSYVRVYSDQTAGAPIVDALTVSLWLKTPQDEENVEECTVLNLAASSWNGKGENSGIKLTRSVNEANVRYQFLFADERVGYASYIKSWDWNMLSFTIINTDLSIFTNGANTSDHPLPMPFPQNPRLNLTLNGIGDDGCQHLQVDEVALWDRALNLTELIALRVGPFNASCSPEDEPTLEDYQTAVLNETLPAASASLQMAHTVTATIYQDLTLKEVLQLKATVNIAQDRMMLDHPNLTEEENQQNRKAFVGIHSTIFLAAREDSEINEMLDMVELVEDLEDTMRGVYFDDFGQDVENISSACVEVMKWTLTVKTDEGSLDDIKLNFGSSNLAVTIPTGSLVDGRSQLLVMIYTEEVASLLGGNNGSWIASHMLSIQLENAASYFNDPITMRFSLDDPELRQIQNGTSTSSCVYLDTKSSEWKKDGLSGEVNETTGQVTCRATHLTNFAILMSPRELDPDPTLSALSYILISISMLCLMVTFLVLMCLPEIANTQRVQILKNFICALFLAQALFVFTTDLLTFSVPLCKLSAVLTHYFWVATFTWMLVQGIQLYTKVRRLVGTSIKQLFYVLFAWGFPLPVAVVPILVFGGDYEERVTGTTPICWIPARLIWFLAVPLIVIFCVNMGVTVLVMKTFLTVKVNKDKTNKEKLKASMRAVIVMVPVLGLTWVFGFLVLADDNPFFQYLFVILNALQGVFVFLFHLVLNDDVRIAMLKRRNKVASNVENTIFTKVQRNKTNEPSGMPTNTTKAPFPDGEDDSSST